MSTLAAVPMGPTSPSVIPRSLKFGPSCCWSLPWLLAAERSPDTVELASQKVEMRGGTSTECAVFGGKALPSPVGPRWAESSLPCCPSTEAPGDVVAQVNRQVGIWDLSPLQEPPPTRRPLQGECALL